MASGVRIPPWAFFISIFAEIGVMVAQWIVDPLMRVRFSHFCLCNGYSSLIYSYSLMVKPLPYKQVSLAR